MSSRILMLSLKLFSEVKSFIMSKNTLTRLSQPNGCLFFLHPVLNQKCGTGVLLDTIQQVNVFLIFNNVLPWLFNQTDA